MLSRIGTRLYVALALAVLLTLLSSGVGVYYFEVSGDLNHRLSREAFPAYEGVVAGLSGRRAVGVARRVRVRAGNVRRARRPVGFVRRGAR